MHQILNDPLDVEWVSDVHLAKLSPPKFQAFEIIGNEDSPDEIRLYRNPDPTILEIPLAIYTRNRFGCLKSVGKM